MVDIKKCTDENRLILQIGNKYWHISYKEANHLLNKLKFLEVDKKEIRLIHKKCYGKILEDMQITILAKALIAIKILKDEIKDFIGGDIRISWQGVPHLLYPNAKKPKYSICYFKKSNKFRLFYPYPSKFGFQHKETFDTAKEIINRLKRKCK